MSSLPGLLLQLIELLAQDDLTVADVAARVGPIARDPGPPLDLELAPVSQELVAATLTRHRKSGAPYLLNIEPATHARSTLREWSAVLGPYRRLRSDLGQPRSVIFDRRRRATRCEVAVIAELDGSGADENQALVTRLHLRRDPILHGDVGSRA